MRYLIVLLALAGCTDYSKLSSGKDMAEPTATDLRNVERDLAGDDLAGDDLRGSDDHDLGTSSKDLAGADLQQPCLSSLANIGAGDFTISFQITTTEFHNADIHAQRRTCDNLSPEGYWDIGLQQVSGQLVVATDDPEHSTDFTSSQAVNDGNPHNILIARTNQILTIYVDSIFSASAPSASIFGALPVLAVTPCTADNQYIVAVQNFCMHD